MEPDFGAAASDYATHRAGFPDSFFARLRALGIGRPAQRVVDLGTGTGTLARGLAAAGCAAFGVDHSHAMVAEARRQRSIPEEKLHHESPSHRYVSWRRLLQVDKLRH